MISIRSIPDFRKDEEALSEQAISSTILDVRDVPVDQLEELVGPVLAIELTRCLQRIKAENGLPLSSFNSGI
jgi:hypothetical protein